MEEGGRGYRRDTTTQTVSLIISETNRTVKRHIITCKQLCHVNLACSSPVTIAF